MLYKVQFSTVEIDPQVSEHSMTSYITAPSACAAEQTIVQEWLDGCDIVVQVDACTEVDYYEYWLATMPYNVKRHIR